MTTHLELHALPHPDPRVRRLGFELTDPYVEQCWGALLGPSGVAILRRAPELWRTAEPARTPVDDLARSLGLGGGTGPNSRFHRSLDRLARFGFGEWVEGAHQLGIYTEVRPLGPRQLEQLPTWTVHAHDRLLGAHLDRLAHTAGHSGPSHDTTTPTPMATPTSDRAAKIAEVAARLDHLQHASAPRASLGSALQR